MRLLLSFPGRVLAWLGGPLLVVYAVLLSIASWPWKGLELLGYGGLVAFSLVLAAWMIAPRRLWWGGDALSVMALLAWLVHSARAFFGPVESRTPWWVPLITFVFIGAFPLMHLVRGLRVGSPRARRHLTFTSSLPGYSSDSEEERPFGQPVLSALTEALIAHGFATAGPAEQHAFYGWAVEVRRPGGTPIGLLLQGAEDGLVLTVDERSRRPKGEASVELETAAAALMKVLATDARFSGGQLHDEESFRGL